MESFFEGKFDDGRQQPWSNVMLKEQKAHIVFSLASKNGKTIPPLLEDEKNRAVQDSHTSFYVQAGKMQTHVEKTLQDTNDYDPWKAMFLPVWKKASKRFAQRAPSPFPATSPLPDFSLVKHLLDEIVDEYDTVTLLSVRMRFFFKKINMEGFLSEVLKWQALLHWFVDMVMTFDSDHTPMSFGPLGLLTILPQHMCQSLQDFRHRIVSDVIKEWQWTAFDGAVDITKVYEWSTEISYMPHCPHWNPISDLLILLEQMDLDFYTYCALLQVFHSSALTQVVLVRHSRSLEMYHALQGVVRQKLESILNFAAWEYLSEDETTALYHHRDISHPSHLVYRPRNQKLSYCEAAKFWFQDSWQNQRSPPDRTTPASSPRSNEILKRPKPALSALKNEYDYDWEEPKRRKFGSVKRKRTEKMERLRAFYLAKKDRLRKRKTEQSLRTEKDDRDEDEIRQQYDNFWDEEDVPIYDRYDVEDWRSIQRGHSFTWSQGYSDDWI